MILIEIWLAGGDCKTLMFVQISPSASDLGETLCSLNFASRVRGIESGPARKQADLTELFKYKQLVCYSNLTLYFILSSLGFKLLKYLDFQCNRQKRLSKMRRKQKNYRMAYSLCSWGLLQENTSAEIYKKRYSILNTTQRRFSPEFWDVDLFLTEFFIFIFYQCIHRLTTTFVHNRFETLRTNWERKGRQDWNRRLELSQLLLISLQHHHFGNKQPRRLL